MCLSSYQGQLIFTFKSKEEVLTKMRYNCSIKVTFEESLNIVLKCQFTSRVCSTAETVKFVTCHETAQGHTIFTFALSVIKS